MIEALTQEQIDKFPFYVDKWVKIGLSTEDVNKQDAENAINKCYELGGISKPKKIIWVQSPIAIYCLLEILKGSDEGDNKLLRDSILTSLESKDSISVNIETKGAAWDSVKLSLKSNINDYLWNSIYGQHSAGWLSFYDFFKNEFPEELDLSKIEGLIELAKTCGWIYTTKDICIASNKPNLLNRDDRGRLHSLSGAALSYRDGWSIYSVNGVRVPEYIILNPELITVDKIKEQNNTEIRRIMINIYGDSKYLNDSGAVMIHKDEFGELYKAEVSDDESIVMVKVINSSPEPDGTFKNYFLRVPPSEDLDKTGILKGDMLRAKQAVAWTFGETEEEYTPEIET